MSCTPAVELKIDAKKEEEKEEEEEESTCRNIDKTSKRSLEIVLVCWCRTAATALIQELYEDRTQESPLRK